MATRTNSGSPWPRPTPHPSSSKGKRKWDPGMEQIPDRVDTTLHHIRRLPRASVDSDNCGFVGNDVISCFPIANSTVVQNIDTRFVWNTNLPQFSQTRLVDVYLYHGDSDELVMHWSSIPYQTGHLAVLPNDTWWGDKGPDFTPGKNSTQTFYFLMVVNGTNHLSQPPQTTFTATQTDFPNSILSSRSSASLASASVASVAAEISIAVSASLSRGGATSESTGALQNGGSSSNNLPSWAIALLAIFGFLALISFLFVLWLLIRNLRSRKPPGDLGRRNSIGSQSPMMANVDPQSNVAHSSEGRLGPLPAISNRHNIVSSDGASTVSHADSAGGPFSAVDAAAMAAAFRNVMRKPDFADRPMEEGESPEHKEADVLNRELAEEGRDIRSVSSSRGVKVETLSDAGDMPH